MVSNKVFNKRVMLQIHNLLPKDNKLLICKGKK